MPQSKYDPLLQTPQPAGVLEPLSGEIRQCIYTVAPEREEELKKLMATFNISVSMDTYSPEHEYNAIWSATRLSIQGLERLWVYSCGAMYAFIRQQETSFREPFSFLDDALGKETKKLLDWAYKADTKKDYTKNADWPSLTLLPTKRDDGKQLVEAADSLFLGIVAFVILHEIGHIFFQHQPPDELERDQRFRQEFEADAFAYNWIMDKWRTDSNSPSNYRKRSVRTGSMISILAILTMYGPTEVKRIDHPNPIDRLLRFLLKHANEDSRLDWALCWRITSLILNTHLSNVEGYDATLQTKDHRKYLNDIRRYFGKIENPSL